MSASRRRRWCNRFRRFCSCLLVDPFFQFLIVYKRSFFSKTSLDWFRRRGVRAPPKSAQPRTRGRCYGCSLLWLNICQTDLSILFTHMYKATYQAVQVQQASEPYLSWRPPQTFLSSVSSNFQSLGLLHLLLPLSTNWPVGS